MADRIDGLADRIDELTEQSKVFMAGLTELRQTSERQAESAARQAESITQLAQTSQRQEENISRLVGVVEKLIEHRA
jgi:methyl-accepting chemotaxis protein